jgi:two-component system nitrate/nitrite response regulator NarL
MAYSSERNSIVVADDHPVTREGVVRALKSSRRIEVIAEVADGRAALAAIRELRPAIALLDYKMPELDGLDVIHAVTRDELPTGVVLLSAFDDSSVIYEALAEGAKGYLTKESDSDEIVAAVIKCAAGATYLPTLLAGALASEVKQRARGESALLTPREREVVQMIADGLSVPRSRRGCTCRRIRSRHTCRTCTKSSVLLTGALPLRRQCGVGCWNDRRLLGRQRRSGNSTRMCVPTGSATIPRVPPAASTRAR